MNKLSILIIDDEKIQAESLEKALLQKDSNFIQLLHLRKMIF